MASRGADETFQPTADTLTLEAPTEPLLLAAPVHAQPFIDVLGVLFGEGKALRRTIIRA